MSVIGWVILGVIAGFVSSTITDGGRAGLLLDVILGILGAVAGGFVFSAVGGAPASGVDIYSFSVAAVCAVLVLLLFHWFFGPRLT